MLDRGSFEETWSRLGLYLSRDVMERRYEAFHRRQLNAGKAREIIAHFEQGQQYFTSAANAGVLAGPLEQYYGALAFARGLVLFLTPELREAGLKKSHGLQAELPGDECLENIEISVVGGSFSELLEATGNVELLALEEPHPGRAPTTYRAPRILPRPPDRVKFAFVELLARIPGIRPHFEESFGRPAQCFAGSAWLFGGTVNVRITRDRVQLPETSQLIRLLRLPADAMVLNSEESSVQFEIPLSDGQSVLERTPNVIESLSGGQTIIAPFTQGWCLSELASYMAASYTLSMLVRYYPSRWSGLFSRDRGDRLLPVVNALRRLVQSEFVRLILWELEGHGVEQRTSMVLG